MTNLYGKTTTVQANYPFLMFGQKCSLSKMLGTLDPENLLKNIQIRKEEKKNHDRGYHGHDSFCKL